MGWWNCWVLGGGSGTLMCLIIYYVDWFFVFGLLLCVVYLGVWGGFGMVGIGVDLRWFLGWICGGFVV